MLKIGLTGGIGSGKTTVADRFKDLGVLIIDTDVIAHDLVNHNPVVLQEITRIFGPAVLRKSGVLDRQKLAGIVFHNNTKKQSLENILHPKIREEINRQLQHYQAQSINTKKPSELRRINYCIIVIPLLLETDFHDLVDHILVVIANQDVRIERIKQRDNRNLDDIHSIMSNQVDDDKRLAAADDIINNNNEINTLNSQIQQLHNKYLSTSNPSGLSG
jgi:dephospho-CoA kinase